MKQFLKFTLATIVGIIVTTIIGFLILIGVISAIINFSDKTTTIKDNSILLIDLDKPIMERSTNNPFKNFDFNGMKSNAPIGLDEIIENIKKARDDNQIKGIYLSLPSVQSRISTIEEIRKALLDFKTSKKFIIAYSNTYTTG